MVDESSHEDTSVVLNIYLLSMAAKENTAPLGYIKSWIGIMGWARGLGLSPGLPEHVVLAAYSSLLKIPQGEFLKCLMLSQSLCNREIPAVTNSSLNLLHFPMGCFNIFLS